MRGGQALKPALLISPKGLSAAASPIAQRGIAAASMSNLGIVGVEVLKCPCLAAASQGAEASWLQLCRLGIIRLLRMEFVLRTLPALLLLPFGR